MPGADSRAAVGGVHWELLPVLYQAFPSQQTNFAVLLPWAGGGEGVGCRTPYSLAKTVTLVVFSIVLYGKRKDSNYYNYYYIILFQNITLLLNTKPLKYFVQVCIFLKKYFLPTYSFKGIIKALGYSNET